jgi:hypothetical protein
VSTVMPEVDKSLSEGKGQGGPSGVVCRDRFLKSAAEWKVSEYALPAAGKPSRSRRSAALQARSCLLKSALVPVDTADMGRLPHHVVTRNHERTFEQITLRIT